MNVQISAEHEPCSECAHWSVCRSGLACEAFATFVETGEAVGDRTPSGNHYIVLFPSVTSLRAKWRRDSVRQGLAVKLGERRKFTRKETQRRYRERRKVLWELDPERRARHLANRRAEGIRRARRWGRAPLGSALHRVRKARGQKVALEAKRAKAREKVRAPAADLEQPAPAAHGYSGGGTRALTHPGEGKFPGEALSTQPD